MARLGRAIARRSNTQQLPVLDLSGSVTATLILSASSTGTHDSTAAVSAPMVLSASVVAGRVLSGSVTATLILSASAVGSVVHIGTATMRLSASVAGTIHNGVAASSAPLLLTASLDGDRHDTGNVAVTAVLRLLTAPTASSTRSAPTVTAAALRLSATIVAFRITVPVAAVVAKAQITVPYELVAVARIPQTSGPPTLLQIDPIDWTGLSFVDELSRPQQLTAGAKVSTLTEPLLQRLRNLAELATEIWLYRNGKLIFAGPLLGWQVQGEAITLQAQGLLAYLKMMVVQADQVFNNVDQFTIAATLINQWQALDYGNFGIDTSNLPVSGVVRDATYLAKELHNVGQRVEELGKRDNGFDLTIEPATRRLRMAYPIQGQDRSVGEDAVVFDARNVTSPNIICSSAPGDVASEAIGTGTGDTALISTMSNLTRRAQYGRSAVTQTFDGVKEQSTLDAHVQGLLNVRNEALLIPGPDTRVTPDSDLSAYDVGDTVSYQLHSQLGLGGAFRLRRRQVTVSKTGQESVTLAFV